MKSTNFKIDNLQYCNWSKEIFKINNEAKLNAIHVTIAYHENFQEVQNNIDTWNKYFKDFKDCKKIFNNKYTLLKEEKIIDIFNNNKELILVTDKIQNFKILNQKFEFNDRLIVEVFTLKDYFKAKLFGIKN